MKEDKDWVDDLEHKIEPLYVPVLAGLLFAVAVIAVHDFFSPPESDWIKEQQQG